jgi:hypothetical protein
MRNYTTSGLIIFLITIMWAHGWIYGEIPGEERRALETFYRDTDGDNWRIKTNWGKAPGTENTWYGITCNAANTAILKIDLSNNNLQGTLPLDMETFSNLTSLDLSNNNLEGEIPPCIVKLTNLKILNLSGNKFEGSIPHWIGSLKNLEVLLLDNNMLQGPIPGELGNLSKLKVLRLNGNRLTGEIPIELKNLINLENNQSDFRWNGFYTKNIGIRKFLKQKQIGGDWESTQTVAPLDIKVVGFTENTITIHWKPITYTANTGGYRVFYREEGKSYDYKNVETTIEKNVNEVTFKELKKSTRYYFKIQTWTNSHNKNRNKIESIFSEEFPVATRGIIISGTVKNKKIGKGFPGVQLMASNGGGIVVTDKDGIYKLSLIPGWTGKVTPFKEGLEFFPPSINYDYEVTEDIPSNDYTAISNTVISGNVTYNGIKVGAVTIKFTGENGDNYTALTDEDGNYEIEVSYNWSGSVTPIKDRHQFNPKEIKYNKVTSPQEQQNYEVQFPKISGQVKDLKGKGISGIKLKFSNVETDKFKYLRDSTVTDEKGNYEIDALENWIGSVKLDSFIKTKYIFYPPSREIKKFEDAKKPQNFKAERDFKVFILITSSYMVPSEDSFDDFYGNGLLYQEIAAGWKFIRNFFIWGGFGFASKNGNAADLGNLSQWRQKYLSLGFGYHKHLSIRLAWKASVGAVSVSTSEKWPDEEVEVMVDTNSIGVRIEVAGIYKVSKRLFTEISVGYLYAGDTIENEYINLGSLKVGFSLGLRF